LRSLLFKRLSIAATLAVLLIGYWYLFPSPWSERWLSGKTFWYSLYWKGEKVGHVQQSYQSLENNIFQVSRLTRVKILNRGQPFQLTEKEVFQFDMAHSGDLYSAFYHHQQDDFLEQLNLSKEQQGFEGTKLVNNQKSSIRLDANGYGLSEFLKLMQWVEGQPEPGERLNVQRLDLRENAMNSVQYQLVEQNSDDKHFKIKFQQQGRDWHGTVAVSPDGVPKRYLVGQMVEQRLTSRREALSENSSSDYYLAQVISIDQPLGDTSNIQSLVLATANHIAPADFVIDKRQFLDSNGYLHINSTLPMKTHLREPIAAESQVGQLADLALSIVAGSQNTEQKVTKLRSFVADYLQDSPVIRPMTINDILTQRKGDCTEHTELFIALARAIGIKAREVHGLVYLGDDIQGFGGHVWSEVLMGEQWVGVDPTWDISRLSATHIQLKEGLVPGMFNHVNGNKDNDGFSLKAINYH